MCLKLPEIRGTATPTGNLFWHPFHPSHPFHLFHPLHLIQPFRLPEGGWSSACLFGVRQRVGDVLREVGARAEVAALLGKARVKPLLLDDRQRVCPQGSQTVNELVDEGASRWRLRLRPLRSLRGACCCCNFSPAAPPRKNHVGAEPSALQTALFSEAACLHRLTLMWKTLPLDHY